MSVTAALPYVISGLLVVGFQGARLLPSAIVEALSRAYPGWRFPDTTPSLEGRDMGLSTALSGDYDGNGLEDHAVLIEYDSNDGGTAKRFKRVLAVLRHPERLQVISLTDALPFDQHSRVYLRPTPKGSRGMDMNDYREFIYDRDAITVVSEACRTFVYRGKGFASLWTCD